MKIGIVPGTFDPITFGHLDIIQRGSRLMDQIIVAVAESKKKKPLLSLQIRTDLVKQSCKDMPNVSVKSFDGLLIDFASENNATCLIKGLRVVTDFEYEFQMAALNNKMAPYLDTVFVMSPPSYMHLSSTQVKELASLGGSVNGLVPKCVENMITKVFH